ncbi:unnamed protein product [Mytilus coruscus]|uniref:Ig-like domain-containing protein n=1 Tax=Mytilus coruscus TaxID=42192 RepID=A0A6J8EIC3_MYTCO|nr:unnamed protein product [Mytilus coruscus]
MMAIQYQYIYRWMILLSCIYGFCEAEHTVIGHVDSTIILNCTLDGTITWYGPAKNPPPPEAVYFWKNQSNAPDIPDNLRPRLSVVGDFNHGRYNLKIQKLQVTDQGLYMCELKGSVDKFRLKVIAEEEQTVTGHVNSTIILNCTLDGTITWYGPAKNPPPPEAVYSWKNQLNAPDIPDNLRPRLSVVGDFNHGRYNLKIKKLQVTDQGLYMCELKDSVDKLRLKVIEF